MWSTKDLIYLGAVLIWSGRIASKTNYPSTADEAIKKAKEIFNKVYEESND